MSSTARAAMLSKRWALPIRSGSGEAGQPGNWIRHQGCGRGLRSRSADPRHAPSVTVSGQRRRSGWGPAAKASAQPPWFSQWKSGASTGFVTPSDLNKHPVRTHFYLLLADLEMTMAARRERHTPISTPYSSTSRPCRSAKVRERHDEAVAFNIDADSLTALSSPDLLTRCRNPTCIHRLRLLNPAIAGGLRQVADAFRDQVHASNERLPRAAINRRPHSRRDQARDPCCIRRH